MLYDFADVAYTYCVLSLSFILALLVNVNWLIKNVNWQMLVFNYLHMKTLLHYFSHFHIQTIFLFPLLFKNTKNIQWKTHSLFHTHFYNIFTPPRIAVIQLHWISTTTLNYNDDNDDADDGDNDYKYHCSSVPILTITHTKLHVVL